MKGLLSLLNQKKTSHCSICLSIQKAYPDVWNTRQWRREGWGSWNVTGGDFYPWIIVENWFRFSSSHWTMLRTITRYSIHKLDILGQTNFNYFVKKITFLRIFRFGRFCSVFKVLQLSSWFWSSKIEWKLLSGNFFLYTKHHFNSSMESYLEYLNFIQIYSNRLDPNVQYKSWKR